jgi:hypothetical protein
VDGGLLLEGCLGAATAWDTTRRIFPAGENLKSNERKKKSNPQFTALFTNIKSNGKEDVDDEIKGYG